MAQTTSLVFNGGVIPSPSPAPSGSGKAKLLKIGEITVTEQEVQVTKNVICDPDSVTTVAPFMEVLTSARLAELISANNILVLDDGTMQYLMSDATISVEDGTSVCTAVNFLGLSKENRAKVLYPCTRLTDELTLQQVIEVGEPVETDFNLVKADPEDTEAGTLIDKLEVVDNVRDSDDPDDPPLLHLEVTVDGQGNRKVAINEDTLKTFSGDVIDSIETLTELINERPSDEHGYFNSSIYTTPGDGTTTSLVMGNFRISENRDVHGDSIEFVPTHQEGGVDFGEVWLEPGTYILATQFTLQWVGNPRGTFLPLVANVADQPFDFSYEHEDVVRTTRIITKTTRGKLLINIAIDADTPPMGVWVKNLEVAQIASLTQSNVVHDTTLTGTGKVGDPLGVTPAAFGKIKNIPTSINQFRNGDVIPVDGPNGPAKMPASELQDAILGGPVDEAVQAWLDEHPEATTTVQDSSLTEAKFSDTLKLQTIKDYVTPGMFGAKGDGTTVDNVALNACFAYCVQHGVPCDGIGKTYIVDDSTEGYCGHYGLICTGGITIRNCHLKLKSGCPDMTTILSGKYDTNEYVFENCIFEGELRTITTGMEDGGNNGIFLCNGGSGEDKFPPDWQEFAGVKILNCRFVTIQSYGIFPTPIHNKIVVKDSYFNCHGPGILSYATDCVIENCEYVDADGTNVTVKALATDEIENFSSPTAYKKNISIKNCSSTHKVYQIQHTVQAGVIYGTIEVIRCYSYTVLIQTYYDSSSNYYINADKVLLKDCTCGDSSDLVDPFIHLAQLICDDIRLDNVTVNNGMIRLRSKGSVVFVNCHLKVRTFASESDFDVVEFRNCIFSGTPEDAFLTCRWGAFSRCEKIKIFGCTVSSASHLLRELDTSIVTVSGLVATDTQIKLFFNVSSVQTDFFIDGLISLVENPVYAYFIDGTTGKAVIRGISAGLRIHNVTGGVANETTSTIITTP